MKHSMIPVVLSIILIVSISFADGVPYVNQEIPKIPQTAQVAYINWNKNYYDAYLYVNVGPTNSDFYWIIPFDRKPINVQLVNSSGEDFQKKIDFFVNRVQKVENERFLLDDAFNKQKWVLITNPIMIAPDIIYAFMFMGLGSFGISEKSTIQIEPLETFKFGSLGSASVYSHGQLPTKIKEMFSKNKRLSKYTNYDLIVFHINKLSKPTGLLVKMRFPSRGTLFYPSSTTELWSGSENESFSVYIVMPKNYDAASANIWPAVTYGPFKTYAYYPNSWILHSEDIKLKIEPHYRPTKIASILDLYIPLDTVTAVLMFIISWTTPYIIKRKLKIKMGFWRYSWYALLTSIFIWPFMLLTCII